tara:strand:- start:2227 stop:2418 length:192 start_codon:yes stop_codon:yes gene_type:complete
MAPTIEEKENELNVELQTVVDEHNAALKIKNEKYARFVELQASLKTLQELKGEPAVETEVVTE